MKIDSNKYPLPKRLRHHTSSNLYLPKSEIKLMPNNYPPLYEDIKWNDYFVNGKSPDVLDIGCAKGAMLLDYSELHPNENILGIEIRHVLTDWLDNFIRGEKLSNAAVIWYSVVNGLNFIPDNSINKIMYLFPDPFTKQKLSKRRAFNHDTIKDFHNALGNGKRLYLATDVEEVHEYHISLLKQFGGFDFSVLDSESSLKNWDIPVTNKEKFCLKESINTYKIIAYKK